MQIENKFVVGGMDKTKLDEEDKKQRAFKSILNKLTPENFEKLMELVLEEGINEAVTLIGLIAQIFDKALTEPTFAELYAMMCAALNDRFLADQVEFIDPNSVATGEAEPKKITFKRVLLNKCQEEFEKGDGAIKAAEKEVQDALDDKAAKDAAEAGAEAGETKPAAAVAEESAAKATRESGEKLEDGEIAEPVKAKTPEELDLDERRKVAQRAERMLVARRRMLGNIKFIGELYRKSMLTERIMHTCIMKLLGDHQIPDEEDVEALCKLLTTIGGQLDHVRAKEHMDAYFRRIDQLSKNMGISSRHRFMCQDIKEMRSKNWRVRRKEDGPKKIEDVHKDAAREAQNQAQGPPRGGGGGGGPRRDDRGGGGGGDRGGGGGRGGGRDFGNDRGPPQRGNPQFDNRMDPARGGGGDRGGGDRGGDRGGGGGDRNGGDRGGGGDRDRGGGGRGGDRDGRDGRGVERGGPDGRDGRGGGGTAGSDGPPRTIRGGIGNDAGNNLGPRSALGRPGAGAPLPAPRGGPPPASQQSRLTSAEAQVRLPSPVPETLTPVPQPQTPNPFSYTLYPTPYILYPMTSFRNWLLISCI
jgi:translation initiation factor 4G